jgi:hypothetical protein
MGCCTVISSQPMQFHIYMDGAYTPGFGGARPVAGVQIGLYNAWFYHRRQRRASASALSNTPLVVEESPFSAKRRVQWQFVLV